jgi:cell division protein FtsW
MIRRFFACFDNPAALLAVVVAVLVSLGVVMVYSASGARAGLENIRVMAKDDSRLEEEYRFHHGSNYLVKQVIWAGIGLVFCLGVLKIPVEWLEKNAWWILAASLVILLIVATPLGHKVNGARRWLKLGPFTIQPVEFAKIGLVICMAKVLSDTREKVRDFVHGFLPSVGILAIFSILVLLEKDLGTTVLMGGVIIGMWCLARVRVRHILVLLSGAFPILVWLVFQHSYRVRRFLAFIDTEKFSRTDGLQLYQSLIAIGSGGLYGTGIGMGLQKYHFLPESHTDFIFAIICEEMGLIGAVSICLLFLGFILLGFRISYKAPDYFSGLLAGGLTLVIGLAAFINFFVVLGLAPTKGLALPFLSYGGSSMMASLICAALLINISNLSLHTLGSKEEF